MKLLWGEVVEVEALTSDVFRMLLKFEEPFDFKAGQFINIKTSNSDTPLLRRPISISQRIDEYTIELLIKEIGVGTAQLKNKLIGEKVHLIGPLGNGFYIDEINTDTRVLLVGGGIGSAPLRGLYQELTSRGADNIQVINGFSKSPFGGDYFKDVDYREVNEEEEQIFVTDYIEKEVDLSQYDVVFSCGPKPMLQRIAEMARKANIKAQISLEEKMACGIGVCLGCAIKVKKGELNYTYKKVCVDGPVFMSDEVIFDD